MKEECGVFGIVGSGGAAALSYLGLYSLQHRGQESSGIITSDGESMYEHKAMGLVSEVFTEEILKGLKGDIAIGHNRYSTTGMSRLVNAQPFMVNCKIGKIAIAHNGNLINAAFLRAGMEKKGSIFRSGMDSEVILHLIAKSRKKNITEMIIDALRQVEGSYSAVFLLEDRVIAARDPHGFRPLCIGKLDDSVVFASESCAFDILEAEYTGEVAPGEICIATRDRFESIQFSEPADPLSKCIFEYIYFSRPDSRVFGENVDKVRRKIGRRLSQESPVDADMVISVPDSSNTIALGYANQSGIPFELGLIRNHYVGRTFIQPEQAARDWDIRIKFNPVRGVLEGRRIIVVDDSIVRGSTMKKLVAMLRGAGASEIHLRIGSPLITHSCYFGIDTPTTGELIASRYSLEEIRDFLEVESLAYISLEGLRSCVKEREDYCVACFSGDYPLCGEAVERGERGCQGCGGGNRSGFGE
ncbi:MAG: amidophosphoribosyltransferase [Candidatus Latescibacteria bacterium]|nr:amidophosphoribosyltransferase [bacterium]MBD3425502.1 amidophosphoribosyltransferase [Candidatus Latescibacterota bacterium]